MGLNKGTEVGAFGRNFFYSHHTAMPSAHGDFRSQRRKAAQQKAGSGPALSLFSGATLPTYTRPHLPLAHLPNPAHTHDASRGTQPYPQPTFQGRLTRPLPKAHRHLRQVHPHSPRIFPGLSRPLFICSCVHSMTVEGLPQQPQADSYEQVTRDGPAPGDKTAQQVDMSTQEGPQP